MLTKEEYIKLYEKYKRGQCTPAELAELASYEDDFVLQEQPWDHEKFGDKEAVQQRIYQHLQAAIQSGQDDNKRGKIRHTLRKWITYGAAALVLLTLGVYGLIREKNTVPEQVVTISPGGNKAVLVLEDGVEVSLNELGLGEVAIEGEVLARKTGEGALNYDARTPEEVTYHTLRTPRGGQFQLTLADGTKVWLNASSSIRFPTAFTEKERLVAIEGEVFFDVQPDKERPFVVKSASQKATVLGTRFNIMAYADENHIETSLIEGKVQVSTDGAQFMLNPGERTIYDKRNAGMRKASFDPEEILAWQAGYFMFQEENIEGVMRKIARWYDVDIIYQGDMKGKIFSGTVSRFSEVEEILDMLTLTGTVSFTIEGRRIRVMG